MVIHKCKAIFIHVPKTAGRSTCHAILSSLLDNQSQGPLGGLPDEVKRRFGLQTAIQRHRLARDYISSNDVSLSNWNKYYKFATVRNPWDRMVSEWKWYMRASKRSPSLKDFVSWFKPGVESNLSTNKKFQTHLHFQKDFVTDADGNLIVDDIFKFEHIEDDIQIISKKLNVSLKLTKDNTTKHKHYRKYYKTDKDIRQVNNIFKDDIEMFNYEF